MKWVIAPRRQHPLAIPRYTAKYILLLTVPLIRGLRYWHNPTDWTTWLHGSWLDLAALFLLLILPLMAWRKHAYGLSKNAFHLHRGLILRRQTVIPRRAVTTLTVERPLLFRLIHAARVVVDTEAGDHRHADFSLTVGKTALRDFLAQRRAYARRKLYAYQPPWYRCGIVSLFMSDSLYGVLLLATAIWQSGRVLGEGVRDLFLENLNAASDAVRGIPRVAALCVLGIVGGWLVAALRNCLRYIPFYVTRYRRVLTVRTGAFTKRTYFCTVTAINYADIRQTLLSKFLHLDTVFVHCIGYGKIRGTLSLLIPACRSVNAATILHNLLPELRRQPLCYRPAPRSWWRYCRYPALIIALLYPIAYVLSMHLSLWGDILRSLAVIAYIPCLWWLTVTVIDCRTAGISRHEQTVTVTYARRLTFHTVVLPHDKIVAIKWRQSPWQRRRGTGDLWLYSTAEKGTAHPVRNLHITDAQRFIQ